MIRKTIKRLKVVQAVSETYFLTSVSTVIYGKDSKRCTEQEGIEELKLGLETRHTMERTMAIHPKTAIGHIHLTVADLDRSLAFYRDLLGFEVTMWHGDSAVFLSAGGYHHHIGLNTWAGKGATPSPPG